MAGNRLSDPAAYRTPAVSLEDKVGFLRRPDSYPPGVTEVEVLETHMAWVFLAGDLVYKLKKPVRFSYLDYSTIDRRERACRTEFRVNRRTAGTIYLGVVPLVLSPAGLSIGGQGPVVDWLLMMRRLPKAGNLAAAIAAQRLRPVEVDRIARALAAFYAAAPPVILQPGRQSALWERALSFNRRILLDRRCGLPHGPVERVIRVLRRFLLLHGNRLANRARRHRIVDAHGDLRPDHIWLCGAVTFIDRLEFSAVLRALDPLDELAFLDVECRRMGADWIGARLRRRLAHRLGEHPADGLFGFYRCFRALMRARIAIAHLLDDEQRLPEKWQAQARLYLRMATADAAQLQRGLTRGGTATKTP